MSVNKMYEYLAKAANFLWRCILALKEVLILFSLIFLLAAWWLSQPRLKNVDYTVATNSDGGYSVNLTGDYKNEYLYEKTTFNVKVQGKGTDWSNRAQSGRYYAFDDIKVNGFPHADIGYAWIDQDGTNLYLNLYWVHAPNELKPSVVNGKYALSHRVTK